VGRRQDKNGIGKCRMNIILLLSHAKRLLINKREFEIFHCSELEDDPSISLSASSDSISKD
jgi:hypothetical protein